MIDLHLHTTASDGLLAPAELVARAREAGLSIISVTDHDSVGGIAAAGRAAAVAGIRLVPGIEMTAVEQQRDVHILGYFLDPGDAALEAFLAQQRQDRIKRIREMAERLSSLGYPVDVNELLDRVSSGDSARSVGRPALADALVEAGHAADRQDAFARLLGRGRPAFVARCGAGGPQIIEVIHRAGGLASLAHPGLIGDDELIEPLAEAGLDAIEVWHSDHRAEDVERYRALAGRLRLAASGGSDFHGDGLHRACRLGAVQVPPAAFADLEARAAAR